jgi:hypothetical protein
MDKHWVCPVLSSINYSCCEIAYILREEDYSCGKSPMHDATIRFKILEPQFSLSATVLVYLVLENALKIVNY